MSVSIRKYAVALLLIPLLLILIAPEPTHAFANVVNFQGRAFNAGSTSFVNNGCYPIKFQVAAFDVPPGTNQTPANNTPIRDITTVMNTHPNPPAGCSGYVVDGGLFNVLLSVENYDNYMTGHNFYGIRLAFNVSGNISNNDTRWSKWQPFASSATSTTANKLAGSPTYDHNVLGILSFPAAAGDWLGIYGETPSPNYSSLILGTGDDNGQDDIKFRSHGWNGSIDFVKASASIFQIASGNLVTTSGGRWNQGGINLGQQTLNSNSNGWLYLGNNSYTEYGGQGFAAERLHASSSINTADQLCIRGDCRTSWPTQQAENHGNWVFSGGSLYSNGNGNIFASSGSLQISANLQNSGNLNVTGTGVISGNLSTGGNLSAGGNLSTGGNIILNNDRYLAAKDTTGREQAVLHGRWQDNATYLDGGVGGLYLRSNNSATTNLYLPASGGLQINGSANTILGNGRNGDFSLVNKKPGQWLRIGSEDTIAFWGKPGVETDDNPDVKITRNGNLTTKNAYVLGSNKLYFGDENATGEYIYSIRNGTYPLIFGAAGRDMLKIHNNGEIIAEPNVKICSGGDCNQVTTGRVGAANTTGVNPPVSADCPSNKVVTGVEVQTVGGNSGAIVTIALHCR